MTHTTTISDLPLSQLRAIARRVADKSGKDLSSQVRPRNGDPGPLPLSYAQERLWIIQQVEPDNGAYNIASAIRYDGPVNEAALSSTLSEIIRRHQILRTTFAIEGSRPAQKITAARGSRLAIVDLTGLDEGAGDAVASRLALQQARRPFDLAQEPIVRAKLIRLSGSHHVLTTSFHHVAFDGWSSHLFLQEFAALYSSFECGKQSPLPELEIQYADFAVWQREWLQDARLERLVSYWKQQLAGQKVLELPTDHPRPTFYSYRGARESHVLPAQPTWHIQETTRRLGITPFMIFLAAFKTLLYRYSGQDDLSIGVPIANRTKAELEPLIGCFVNTLIFRTDLSGDPTFAELTQRVSEVCRDAYAHQDLPFEKLVDEINPARETGRNPLFQHALNYNNTPSPFVMNDANGGKLRTGWIDGGTSMFELTLNIDPINPRTMEKGETNCVMEYNTDLFDRTTIDRMLVHLEVLLGEAVKEPGCRLTELPILTPQESHQLLREWNDSAVDYPRNRCLHEWFEQQVEKTPDATAIIDCHHRITYRELNRRSNRLARRLAKLGVGPEINVGVCLRRSAEMVIGLLAVLKAGGAYVPLDPDHPRERLTVILENAGAELLLTQSMLLDRLPDQRPVTLVVDQPDIVAGELHHNLHRRIDAENVSYMIYTSGSTGKPKGVAITHGGDSALIEWSKNTYSNEELAGLLASASICFDLSIFEIFVPLALGGKVIMAQNPLQLAELEAKDEITLLNSVPSAMTELLRMQAVPDSVKIVNLAGEALAGSLVQQTYENTLTRRVYNLYGPSEDTTFSTFAMIERGCSYPAIGRPLSQSRMYVLDENQQAVPRGTIGELYIGGEKLARGYCGRGDLTAERFLPNPFSETGGERLYRTGDLARHKAEGTLEYLGRIDHQVKIRGFRIELGEVEAVLRTYEGVKEAVVTASNAAGGLKRLTGYVVEKSAGSAPAGELRRHLQEKLPEYMVPTVFVTLDQMPLNRNGKIDRRSLPVPETARPAPSSIYIAPRTELERSIAVFWQEILDVPQIGLEENFFELGGNSLLMVQLRLKLQSLLGKEIPMMELFRNPTIASLAAKFAEATEPQRTPQEGSTRGEVRKDAVRRRKELRQARHSSVN